MIRDGLHTAWVHLAAGGPIMFPLLILCLWMWLLIISKILEFMEEAHKERRGQSQGDTNWQHAMHTTFSALRTGHPEQDLHLARTLAAEQIRQRQRHVKTVSVLAATAPLLGLLGTVTGMISTFDGMARFGTGNARVMAAGISQAMITTQAGLVIAVPGLFMGNFLRRRAENMARRISAHAASLVDTPLPAVRSLPATAPEDSSHGP